MLAKRQIGEKAAEYNMNTRDLFIQWLSSSSSKKFSSETIVRALDDGSEYCMSRKLSKKSFWDINDRREFVAVVSKLLGMKMYRLTNRKTAVVLDKAVSLYKDFLRHSQENISVESNEIKDADENRSKIYQKLYSISKVYDDPTGITIKK